MTPLFPLPENVIIPRLPLGECVDSGVDPDWWFADAGNAAGRLELAVAVKVCGECPSKQACLEFALDAHIPHGVWGGLTPDQRKPLEAARRAGKVAKQRG